MITDVLLMDGQRFARDHTLVYTPGCGVAYSRNTIRLSAQAPVRRIRRSQVTMLFDKTTFTEDRDEMVSSRWRKTIAFVILFLFAAVVVFIVYKIESWHPYGF